MFVASFQYVYLILALSYLLVWTVFFVGNKSTRSIQLKTSIAGAIFGPLSELFYFRDYWHPAGIWPIYIGTFPLLIEDVLFGFAALGIVSIFFEVVTRANVIRLPKKISNKYNIALVVVISLGTFAIAYLSGINSIYANAIAFMIGSIPILLLRRDLILNALVSGACMMVLMFCIYLILFHLTLNIEYILQHLWLLYGSPLGIRIAGVPLTEMIWGFSFGFFAGPLYKFLRNKKAVQARKLA